MEAINNLFITLLNYATVVGVAASALCLAWAGYLYMFAGGSPHQMERGNSAAWGAVAGLVLILGARFIVAMIQGAIAGAP